MDETAVGQSFTGYVAPIVCRLFPAPWLRRVARNRLGIIPDEMDSGHTPALSHPNELVEWLEAYRAEVSPE